MRKFIILLLFTLSLFITGCKTNENKPVIEGADDLSVIQGTTFDEMEGITATDEEDGDLTALIEIEGTVDTTTVGEQIITYIVEDSDGNETSVEITITVTELVVDEDPVIDGIEDIDVIIGSEFDLLDGVSATDTEDGVITEDITTTGSIDMNELGMNFIYYYVTDSFGNTTIEPRTVTVVFGGEPWEINNPEFEFGLQGWTVGCTEEGVSTFEVVDGVLEVDITNTGTFYNSIIVFQGDIVIDMDTFYKISIVAKADDARPIRFGIVDATIFDDVFNLLDEVVLFDLTTEFVTYEYIFDPDVSLDKVRFGLLMGDISGLEIATKIYIDSFIVEVYIPD